MNRNFSGSEKFDDGSEAPDACRTELDRIILQMRPLGFNVESGKKVAGKWR